MSQLVYDIRNSRYINLTGRCTLQCAFCPKHNGSTEVHQYQLKLDKQPRAEEIIPLLGEVTDFDEIVFCGYGEPTLNLDALLAIARHVKAHGGKTRINTDGLGNLFHRRNILPELGECIDALSISLNAQDEATYHKHCRPRLKGSYEAMRAFLKEAPQHIARVSASAIDGLEGVNITACQAICDEAGVHFRHRALDVVG
ncbi:TatD family nuclease-associated radical SAM protein [Ferrimonas sp.]|uniref:TatD family nuclease-associated radical SAM protein n=1 Tax=Ferrimonas sp. TaxID=2080861 RepID=UPI003A8FEDAF